MTIDSSDLLNLRLAAAAAHDAKNYSEAFDLYAKIIELDPAADDVLINTAEILLRGGKYFEAVAVLDRAISINPNNPLTWYNLGHVHYILSEWETAEKFILRCLELAPHMARAHFVAGNIYRETARYGEAIDAYKASLRINGMDAEAWCNMGLAFAEVEQFEHAATAYLEAIKHDYTLIAAHANLAIVFLQIGQTDGARQAAERALELDPNHANSLNLLGSAYCRWGRHAEALGYFKHGIAADPAAWKIHSNLLFAALHKDGATLPEVLALHQGWYAAHGAPLARPQIKFPNSPDPNRRLRIGFVSGDFRSHPVGYFIFNTFSRLITGKPFDIYVYANQFETEDQFTIRFRNLTGDNWRQIWSVPREKVLAMIAEDQIDVLIDLTGHNSRHRMDVFCSRAAPVQVTWAGYMATTGVPDMDFLLGDNIQTPLHDQAYYAEQLYNMPNSFIAYTPPPDAPPLAETLPYDKNGYLTFACFNKTDKITPRAIKLWSAVLRELPGSRALLKFQGLNDAYLVKHLTDQFAAHGITAERLMFENTSPHHELLARYNEIDIALDPLPYTGSTSTLEALWMATPLITLTGDIFPARHASSYLTAIGAPELIAKTEDEYVQKIIALGRDVPRLRHYKKTLRAQMQNSPMCDQDLFVPEFVRAIRHMWQAWCAKQIR